MHLFFSHMTDILREVEVEGTLKLGYWGCCGDSARSYLPSTCSLWSLECSGGVMVMKGQIVDCTKVSADHERVRYKEHQH